MEAKGGGEGGGWGVEGGGDGGERGLWFRGQGFRARLLSCACAVPSREQHPCGFEFLLEDCGFGFRLSGLGSRYAFVPLKSCPRPGPQGGSLALWGSGVNHQTLFGGSGYITKYEP